MPQITVTIDTNAFTYTFSTGDPTVTPGAESFPIPLEGNFGIACAGVASGVTVVTTLPSTATVTQPYEPAMAPVNEKGTTYKLLAIGQGVLTVPTYGGHALTGTPLTIAASVDLTLKEGGAATPPVSFGALVRLIIAGLEKPTTVTAPPGLFVGQSGTSVEVAPGGSVYTVDDVYEGSYTIEGSTGSYKQTTPMLGTINVSSTKKPKGSA